MATMKTYTVESFTRDHNAGTFNTEQEALAELRYRRSRYAEVSWCITINVLEYEPVKVHTLNDLTPAQWDRFNEIRNWRD